MQKTSIFHLDLCREPMTYNSLVLTLIACHKELGEWVRFYGSKLADHWRYLVGKISDLHGQCSVQCMGNDVGDLASHKRPGKKIYKARGLLWLEATGQAWHLGPVEIPNDVCWYTVTGTVSVCSRAVTQKVCSESCIRICGMLCSIFTDSESVSHSNVLESINF